MNKHFYRCCGSSVEKNQRTAYWTKNEFKSDTDLQYANRLLTVMAKLSLTKSEIRQDCMDKLLELSKEIARWSDKCPLDVYGIPQIYKAIHVEGQLPINDVEVRNFYDHTS